jgi:hypothetical protein
MMKEVNAGRGKYANLELDLAAKTRQYRDYQQLKNIVMYADVHAQLRSVPKYLEVSKALNLNESATKELEKFYSTVMRSLNLGLYLLKREFIGKSRDLGLGENINPSTMSDNERRDSVISQFAEYFENLAKAEGLEVSKNIKKVLLYPLLIGPLSTWRKYDNEFVGRIIESIKLTEPDLYLRSIINSIEKGVRAQPGLRET